MYQHLYINVNYLYLVFELKLIIFIVEYFHIEKEIMRHKLFIDIFLLHTYIVNVEDLKKIKVVSFSLLDNYRRVYI